MDVGIKLNEEQMATPFQLALCNDSVDIEIVKLLLKWKHLIKDDMFKNQSTILHYIASTKHVELINFCLHLLERKDLEQRSNIPSPNAIVNHNPSQARATFYDHGSQAFHFPAHRSIFLNQFQSMHNTTLGHEEAIIGLRNIINTLDTNQDTPLHIAVAYGKLEMVQCLLDWIVALTQI